MGWAGGLLDRVCSGVLCSGRGYGVERAPVATASFGVAVAIARCVGPMCGRRPKAQLADPKSQVVCTFFGGGLRI